VDDLSNQALLPSQPVFQQTFGFVVNTNLTFSDLPKDSIAAIFGNNSAVENANGQPDWSKINLTNGNKALAAATAVIVCNREVGSGTRATADIWLTEDGCNTVGAPPSLYDYAANGTLGEPANNFATSLELDCVNGHTNSIGYVSVDNFTKLGAAPYASVKAITVGGVTASNLNSATGLYTDNFEAWITENVNASAIGKTFYTNVFPKLQAVATTTQSLQITAIPGLQGNAVAYPPTAVGATPDYVSDYSRGGNSCSPLIRH
jgi:hypothetical protein